MMPTARAKGVDRPESPNLRWAVRGMRGRRETTKNTKRTKRKRGRFLQPPAETTKKARNHGASRDNDPQAKYCNHVRLQPTGLQRE